MEILKNIDDSEDAADAWLCRVAVSPFPPLGTFCLWHMRSRLGVQGERAGNLAIGNKREQVPRHVP